MTTDTANVSPACSQKPSRRVAPLRIGAITVTPTYSISGTRTSGTRTRGRDSDAEVSRGSRRSRGRREEDAQEEEIDRASLDTVDAIRRQRPQGCARFVQAHPDRDARGVGQHRHAVGGEGADRDPRRARPWRAQLVDQAACEAAERDDHEVDPRARGHDLTQPIPAQIAGARLGLERRARDPFDHAPRRRQHPQQILEVGAAEEVLESPSEPERESDEGEARGAVAPLLIVPEGVHGQRLGTNARDRKSTASPARSVSETSHTSPGSGAEAMPPTAKLLTPAGSGSGCTTSSPSASGLRIAS